MVLSTEMGSQLGSLNRNEKLFSNHSNPMTANQYDKGADKKVDIDELNQLLMLDDDDIS